MQLSSPVRRAIPWLGFFFLLGLALIVLYPDADQQDAAFHYLFARWAGRHPTYFIGVWARPLFTLLYFPAAQAGYGGAKLFTLALGLVAAWQTVRLAESLELERAELAVPLLLLQPAFFLLHTATYTETLFALVFAIGLRLHLAGRIRAGMLVASMLILARPEGLFLGLLWGVWVLHARGWRKGLPEIPLLATGMVAWWLGAWGLTGDPMWIRHDWPPDWRVDGKANGTGPLWWYLSQLPVIVGPFLLPAFLLGIGRSRRAFLPVLSSVGLLLLAHSLMFWRGWFGSAGYARYLVCVSPAIALLTLAGWNAGAKWLSSSWRPIVGGTALAASLLAALVYLDGWQPTRDARAIDAMQAWWRAHEQPVSHLINSQAYARVVFDRDPWERVAFEGRREANLRLLRESPPQTLVLWDTDTGPRFFGLRAEDFEAAGFRLLHEEAFRLEGRLFPLPKRGQLFGGTRDQRMTLLYKDAPQSATVPRPTPSASATRLM